MSNASPLRQLIVNADDFGRSSRINAGIIDCHQRGIVTSTSLMVRSPAAREAASLAKRFDAISVGLHIDLGAWYFDGSEWQTRYEVVPLNDRSAVEEEIQRQLHEFKVLLGTTPSHLDSHQHVHRDDPVRSVVEQFGRQLGIPVREQEHNGISYRGDFHGQTGRGEPYHQALEVDHLVEILQGLPQGITELGCHPARGGAPESSYNIEREMERVTLCDRRVRGTILSEEITLISFRDIQLPQLTGS